MIATILRRQEFLCSGTKEGRLYFAGAERDGSPQSVANLVLRIDAQSLQQAGRQVRRRDRLGRRVGGEAVRPADYPAARCRTAGYNERIALRPVIAAARIHAVAGELPEARR